MSWFRDSPHEKAGVTEAELREIGSAPPLQHHGMRWALAICIPALWRIAAIAACYVYTLGFFQGWLQTYLVRGRGFTEAALVLSSLTYVVGATANGVGGMVGDWMVRRHSLRNGRAGLSVAALSLTVAIFASEGTVTRRSFPWWRCSHWGRCCGGRWTPRANCFRTKWPPSENWLSRPSEWLSSRD